MNRIANVLTRDLGMVPGNRVLLRAPNNPMMVAAYFAVIKAGGVVVATMPLLRAKELTYPLAKAKIALALCDARLADEMEKAKAQSAELKRVVYWGGAAPDALETLMMKPGYEHFTACDTASDDVCLIAFTSGTTGEPKGTMHFHRDMLAICDCYAKHVLRAEPTDRFTGSPPLAFTFGLGGLVLFPLRIGASTVLLEKAGPDELLDAIAKYKITIPFTAPTAYRAMLGKLKDHDISSLRKCVSAGETLAEGDLRRLARRDRHQDPRRHRRDRDAAHLHRLARARGARRARPASRCRATRRASSTTTATTRRPAPSAASRCAARPAAAISPTSARRNTCRTAGTSPATPT